LKSDVLVDCYSNAKVITNGVQFIFELTRGAGLMCNDTYFNQFFAVDASNLRIVIKNPNYEYTIKLNDTNQTQFTFDC